MDPRLRASDADRERAVAALTRHAAEGRLSLDEFAERSAWAYRTRTFGELAAVTADLPPVARPRRSSRILARLTAGRLRVVAAVVLATLVGVGIVDALKHALAQ